MTARPRTSATAAEAVVNLDGTGTWSIGGGLAEPITAGTAAAARAEVLRRALVAAKARGTTVDLTTTLAGVPTVLQVSPTGDITHLDDSGVAQAAAESRRSRPRPRGRVVSREAGTTGKTLDRPRYENPIAAGLMVLAFVGGVLLMRTGGDSSPTSSMVPHTRPGASAPATSPSTSTVVPAAARPRLDVTATAKPGGPLIVRVRATSAPTVATLTIWHAGRRLASRRLHLTAARTPWSSRTIAFQHTGPGSYRWAATAPGAARVSGTYTVPVNPVPRHRSAQHPTRIVTVGATPPPSQAPAPSAPVAGQPSATSGSSTSGSSTPPPPSPTPHAAAHNGPVPGGNTNPPHTGPRP